MASKQLETLVLEDKDCLKQITFHLGAAAPAERQKLSAHCSKIAALNLLEFKSRFELLQGNR